MKRFFSANSRRAAFISVFAVILIVTGYAGSIARASASVPGSPEDPLVSRSYVDEKFYELEDRINALSRPLIPQDGEYGYIVDEVMRQVEAILAAGGSSDTYTPVFAAKGQIITGGEGTEIILRSGGAFGYIPGANGISDLTAGVEIMNNSPIYLNHLLIVPRDDGRGIRVTVDSWLLIKGKYTVSN